jgi:hypothetical protein
MAAAVGVGVSDLFLRCPASCCGSGRSSGGGDPDIGGEGRDAQAGEGNNSDRLMFGPNLGGSISILWVLR